MFHYNIPISKKTKKKDKCSSGHEKARNLLKKIFPLHFIVEELRLPGTKEGLKKDLYADFFVFEINLVVEVHGQQHYEYTPFFHNTIQDFFESKKRDRRKKDWCELNNITYIELSDKEDVDEWERKIKSILYGD